MGVFTAAAAAMKGEFDRFDVISEYIDRLIERLQHDDTGELVEAQLDRDTGNVVMDLNIVDHADEMIQKLKVASQQMDDICLLCQQVLAALPD